LSKVPLFDREELIFSSKLKEGKESKSIISSSTSNSSSCGTHYHDHTAILV
jgi:hypothetical protein